MKEREKEGKREEENEKSKCREDFVTEKKSEASRTRKFVRKEKTC